VWDGSRSTSAFSAASSALGRVRAGDGAGQGGGEGGEGAGVGEVFEAQSVESAAEVVEGVKESPASTTSTGGLGMVYAYGAIDTSRARPPEGSRPPGSCAVTTVA
jgi:hypothetical protein